MRIFFLLLLLFLPGYVFSVDDIKETTVLLKHWLTKDIIPYLKPHLSDEGKIFGQDKNITIRSSNSNINELLIIIGDLDRIDYLQLIISITMNIQAVHNLNTRNIQVGANTWTKINYGIKYSNRVREKLPNGNMVEKINYVKVVESFQVLAKIDGSNKKVTLILRPTEEDSSYTEADELSDSNLKIKIEGNVNKWINLGDAINSLYASSDEDPKILRERRQLTSKLGIKVQLLQ